MKTANSSFKQGFFRAAALLGLTLLAASAGAQVTGFANYCELRLTGCPQDYDKKELTVPIDVVSLSTHVRACGRQDAVEMVEGPAVMFIIDHSTSMDQNGVDNDANGNRFRVTQALIDSIYDRAPNAEIGLVLFANGLVFNVNRDANLVKFEGIINPKAPPALTNQAYMPLLQLDQPAKPRGGTSPFSSAANPKVIDVYRAMFTVPANVNQKSSITGGPVTQSGTDISIAFEAALEAFKNTSKAKDNQYIIFLSDGEPGINVTGTDPDVGCPSTNNPRCALLNSFTAGTNFPPTYTVYLQKNPTTVPPLIATMTDNVKKNGYSVNNQNSNAWALEANFSRLLTLMMDEIVSKMFKESDAKAKTIVISSAGVKDTTSAMDGNFTFKRQLPMDTTALTNVSMSIRYDVQIDSTLKDGRDTSWIVPDSLFVYDFTVRRSENPGANWNKDEDGLVFLDTDCKTRTLDLQFEGVSVKEVKGNMGKLDIVFSDESNPTKVNIEVRNAVKDALDVENFALALKSGKWTYQFQRDVAPANPGNGKLEHVGQDSIILVYRNPNVPLDTLRLAVPYIANNMSFYRDNPGAPDAAKLLPDSVTVKAGDSLNIYAKLFDPIGNWDEAMTNSGKIEWTVVGTPSVTLTKDGAYCLFRTETAGGTYIVTATYTDGPLVVKKDITIKVIPGPAEYIEIVTDSAKVANGKVKDRVVNKNGTTDTVYLRNEKKYEFGNGEESKVFYAVLRDYYGNFISMADGSTWGETTYGESIVTSPIGDASSVLASKKGYSFNNNMFVTVEKTVDGKTLKDAVNVIIFGPTATAVGPNPFVPGVSLVMNNLRQHRDPKGELVKLYEPIVAGSKSGGGKGNADNVKGVLITATARGPIREESGGDEKTVYAKATAIIYDAVGHIVFKSDKGDIVLTGKGSSTFGFVWNGKNLNNRTVGPGTYAMRMTATMDNGEKYAVQSMIGVTDLERERNR